MAWFWAWLTLGVLLAVLMLTNDADAQTYLFCVIAWCGGVVSTFMVQAFNNRRAARGEL